MELSELFDEFVEEYNQGRNPKVEAYLHRCPSNEKEFQNLIDVFLMARHNLPGDFRRQSWRLFSESFFADEMNSLKQLEPMALGDALIYLSRKFEMPRRSVVKALMKRLRLDTKNQAKVERFHWQYHRLENNFINPKQVSRRLLEVAAAVFQIPVSYLEDAQLRSDYLATAPSTEMKIAARVAETRGIYRERSPQPQADDQFKEIDQLFTGGELKDNVE